jgi:hypothetical protein
MRCTGRSLEHCLCWRRSRAKAVYGTELFLCYNWQLWTRAATFNMKVVVPGSRFAVRVGVSLKVMEQALGPQCPFFGDTAGYRRAFVHGA